MAESKAQAARAPRGRVFALWREGGGGVMREGGLAATTSKGAAVRLTSRCSGARDV
jgi:hypothetical protein